MIHLPFTLEINKLNELRAIFDSHFSQCHRLALTIKSARAPHTDGRVVSETWEQRHDLEIRPVLLQLGVVHVNSKQLETYTNMYCQCDRAAWTLPHDNRKDMYYPSKKFALNPDC